MSSHSWLRCGQLTKTQMGSSSQSSNFALKNVDPLYLTHQPIWGNHLMTFMYYIERVKAHTEVKQT